MILSNREIERALRSGDLILDPPPPPLRADDPTSLYDTTAINLRLGPSLSLPTSGRPFTFDLRPGGVAAFLAENYTSVTVNATGGYALQPGEFALGATKERVGLPLRAGRRALAARIEGRSSLARCGLIIHFTAPTIHAGFDGTIPLEMKNLGSDLPIAQLIVEKVAGHPVSRVSQFQGQRMPSGLTRR